MPIEFNLLTEKDCPSFVVKFKTSCLNLRTIWSVNVIEWPISVRKTFLRNWFILCISLFLFQCLSFLLYFCVITGVPSSFELSLFQRSIKKFVIVVSQLILWAGDRLFEQYGWKILLEHYDSKYHGGSTFQFKVKCIIIVFEVQGTIDGLLFTSDADNLKWCFFGCLLPLRFFQNPIVFIKPCDGFIFLHLSHGAWLTFFVLLFHL